MNPDESHVLGPVPEPPNEARVPVPPAVENTPRPASSEDAVVNRVSDGLSRPETPSRVVVVETVYHHAKGYHPEAEATRFSSFLDSDEQRFTRRTKATDRWASAGDVGCWLDAASLVVVKNDAKKGSPLVVVVGALPSPPSEPRDMFSEGQLVVDPVPFAAVYPGEDCRFRPVDLAWARFRSATGEPCPVTVSVYPV